MWLAFDIGCIECGEGSSVIGVYATEGLAKLAAQNYRPESMEDWHGAHECEVFELEIPQNLARDMVE